MVGTKQTGVCLKFVCRSQVVFKIPAFAQAEQCVVVFGGVFGVEPAQESVYLLHGPAVVLVAVQYAEHARHVSHVYVQRYRQLRRFYVFPYSQVHYAVAAHHPAQEKVQSFAGRAFFRAGNMAFAFLVVFAREHLGAETRYAVPQSVLSGTRREDFFQGVVT